MYICVFVSSYHCTSMLGHNYTVIIYNCYVYILQHYCVYHTYTVLQHKLFPQ